MSKASSILAISALSAALLGFALAGPFKSVRVSATLSGTLDLTIDADPAYGDEFWAVLSRESATREEEFQVLRVRAGATTPLVWREEIRHPRDWKLRFGPTKHPAYRLILIPGNVPRPVVRLVDLDGFHDSERALAIAYFAIPIGGRRPLALQIRRPAPLEVAVLDSAGAPIAGATIVGIPTPRYTFLDGFDPEDVGILHLSWPRAYKSFDHAPTQIAKPFRSVKAKTDAAGICRLDAFVGWVGIPEDEEKFVVPRTDLAMPDRRRVELSVVRKPPMIRLTASGLPGRDVSVTEHGLLAEGEWPLAGGKSSRWTERLAFVHGDGETFFTPCREVRLRPLSDVHRITSGERLENLQPGEFRRVTVKVEEAPHRTIEGEVVLEKSDLREREYCTIELYESGPDGRLLHASGSLKGPGVPASGRVPFAFHVKEAGPYDIVVKTAHYPWTVVKRVSAPREELVIRLSPDARDVSLPLRVRDAEGREIDGAIVGSWPHRELLSDFVSGAAARGKPGLNSFIVYSDAGSAILRDVRLGEGPAPSLEVRLSPGTTLQGRLVDAAGRPQAGHWVHLSWPGYYRVSSAYRWLADRSGEDGRFEISNVPPGPWRLYLRASGAPLGAEFAIPAGAPSFDAGDRMLPARP